MTPAAVIFDLDGTLVDSAPSAAHAANQALKSLGHPPLPDQMIRSFIGNGADVLMQRCLVALDQNPDSAAVGAASRAMQDAYAADPASHSVIYPGVQQLLQALQDAGRPMAICSNKPAALVPPVLEHFGLDRYFAVITGAGDAPLKPDPTMLLATCRALGTDPARGLFVGDSEVDAATAKAADMHFALFSGGYRKSPTSRMFHHLLFDDHPALIRQLGVSQG